jgi:capsular exopolysaccharide synthesis family protein
MSRKATGEVIPLESAREGLASPAASTQAVAPDLRDYLAILTKRRWVLLAFFVLTVAGATTWVFRLPRIYRATTTIEMSLAAARFTSLQDVSDSATPMYWQTKEFFETQFQIIRSRVVCKRVVEGLGLQSDLAFLGLDKLKDQQLARKLAQSEDAIGRLQGMILIEPIKDSRVVRLGVEDTDPARAAKLVNALAEAYVTANLDRKLDTTRAAGVWLSDQLQDLKGKLENSELTLHDFKRENDILTASIEDRQNIVSQRLLAFNDALTKVSVRRAELESKRRALEEARRREAAGDRSALEELPSVARNSVVLSLRDRLLLLEQERVTLGQRYLDKHPKLAELDGKVAELREALRKEVDKVVRLDEAEVREVGETERQLQGLIAGAKRESFELNRHQIDFNKLKREQDNNQRLYDLVLARLKETELLGHQANNNVSVLDRALVPHGPVKPNRKTVVIISIIVGLLGGIGLALFFEYMDNTIKTHDDIEKFLGTAFLGIVPAIREQGQENLTKAEAGRNRDLHSHRRPKSSAAECVRSIRTNLLFMTPDTQLRRLLITSAGPQEGKTTVATNIAITMAQSGSRTLLIDTDMRRPRIHRAFGLPNDAGMSNLIMGQAKADDVIKETIVPNLWILPCGPVPPNPAELLHTQRFKQIAAELEAKFDRVIFDSPPVGAVADALILSGDVDGVVLVVKAGRTVREVALRTKQSLDDINARVFGVVMNDVDLERRGYGYYYYYQRYGYYYGEKPSEA